MKKRIVKIALGQFASIHGETQQNLNKMLTMTDQAAESETGRAFCSGFEGKSEG